MPTKLIRKQFLLSEEEDEHLQAKARREGLSVSNLTRKLFGLPVLESGGARIKANPSKAKRPIKKRK